MRTIMLAGVAAASLAFAPGVAAQSQHSGHSMSGHNTAQTGQTTTSSSTNGSMQMQNRGTNANANANTRATFTTEQRTAYDGWPTDRRTAYDAWPQDVQSYYWSLTPEQQNGWWMLDDNQRNQLYAMTPPQRTQAWNDIGMQMAARNGNAGMANGTMNRSANSQAMNGAMNSNANAQTNHGATNRNANSPLSGSATNAMNAGYGNTTGRPVPGDQAAYSPTGAVPVCQPGQYDNCMNPWEAGKRGPGVKRPLEYWPGDRKRSRGRR